MDTQKEQHYILVVDKKNFKQEIAERIIRGETLINKEIFTNEDKTEWWEEFINWDTYNFELIKQAFDKPNNSHALEYKRKISFPGVIFSGQTERIKSFQETIESTRDEMHYQLKKLKWFDNIIGLQKTNESQASGNYYDKLHQLINLLTKFHKLAQELRNRREDRATLIIKDEYDVQDFLYSLLHLHFEDIRKEESCPSNSGANSRIDFALKNEKIILEVKMTREKLGSKELGNELLIDIGRYKSYPDCSDLVIFIYDKGDHIRNKKGLINDLQKHSTNELTVTVIINPD